MSPLPAPHLGAARPTALCPLSPDLSKPQGYPEEWLFMGWFRPTWASCGTADWSQLLASRTPPAAPGKLSAVSRARCSGLVPLLCPSHPRQDAPDPHVLVPLIPTRNVRGDPAQSGGESALRPTESSPTSWGHLGQPWPRSLLPAALGPPCPYTHSPVPGVPTPSSVLPAPCPTSAPSLSVKPTAVFSCPYSCTPLHLRLSRAPRLLCPSLSAHVPIHTLCPCSQLCMLCPVWAASLPGGTAEHGSARHNTAQHSLAWQNARQLGTARHSAGRLGSARLGMAWGSTAWHGTGIAQHGSAGLSMA